MKHFCLFCIGVLCGVLVGCGPKLPEGLDALYPVTITVTQESKPLAGATVVLAVTDGSVPFNVGGVTGEDGTVAPLTQGEFPGIPKGTFKVRITKVETEENPDGPDPGTSEYAEWSKNQKPGKTWSLVDPTYRTIKTTPLEITVEGPGHFDLDAGKAVRVEI